jgi:chromosome segregation ATPase
MSDTDRKEESWIRKLPKVIFALAMLIFIIIIFNNHNQYIKWKKSQSALTGKIQHASEELKLLREANGSLQEVTKKAENLRQQAAEITAVLEKLNEEKINSETAVAVLHDKLKQLDDQVVAGQNRVTELTKEVDTLKDTNKRLRDDIVNRKNVLDSIAFLQRQKPALEQSIHELKTRKNLAVEEVLEQQVRLEALQASLKEGEVAIQTQSEQREALSSELSELTEAVKELSSQKEKIAMLDDHQKKLEYLEYLRLQKESLEISINSLLERGKILEEGAKPQQVAPVNSSRRRTSYP